MSCPDVVFSAYVNMWLGTFWIKNRLTHNLCPISDTLCCLSGGWLLWSRVCCNTCLPRYHLLHAHEYRRWQS